jgi:hypothetical protein
MLWKPWVHGYLFVFYLLSYSRSLVQGDNVTYQIASDADSRGNFTRNGKLNGQQDPNLRPISDNSVFAISRDLGTILFTNESVVWAIGYTTDPATIYSDLSGTPPMSRSPYYKVQYSDDEELASIYGNSRGDNMSNIKGQIVDFLNDYSNASSRSWRPLNNDSRTITNELATVTSITLAQVYSSMLLTIGTDEHGNPNKSDVMVFMKNIGGVKKKWIRPNCFVHHTRTEIDLQSRVNAVETLYAAFPALMYLDPLVGAPLLEPLLQLQASSNYTIGYAAADLGASRINVNVEIWYSDRLL